MVMCEKKKLKKIKKKKLKSKISEITTGNKKK